MRRYLLGILFIVFYTTGFCAVVPNDITKTVVFIYKDASGSQTQADGTGFIVSIPSPIVPDRSWCYLITAKHVVHTNSNDFNSPLYPSLWIRVNKKSGGYGMYKIDIIPSGKLRDIYFHSDISVDIAVISINLDGIDNGDILALPEQMLTSADDMKNLNIGIGTDMFFTGMFTGFIGEKKSYPIVRFGKLAMIPDENITFAGMPAEGYLMEAFAFGGNSGSPVFFYPSADNTPGSFNLSGPIVKIAGLMRGFFGDAEQIQLLQTQIATSKPPIPVSLGNTGIAFVVPAKFISEILHSPDLNYIRQINH